MVRSWFVRSSVLIVVGVLGACSSNAHASTGPSVRTLHIVAGENFWGSIVSQLAGRAGTVTNIVTDPNADPHNYESSSDDARAFATADYVVLNGAGYDAWADKLLSGNPNARRKVFTVADLLGKKEGDNPHFWYNPDYVEQVANQMSADFKVLDPADATYFSQQRTAFENALEQYHTLITEITRQFGGQKVGATEDIFVYLSNALGLDLISPPAFMQAVAEGNDPPAASVATFQQQLAQRQITVLVYNVQTATSVTTTLKQLATQQNIPVVGISETMQPPNA